MSQCNLDSPKTTRLSLRPYREADWDAFRSLVQDSERMQRLSGALAVGAARTLFERLVRHDAASGLLGWAATTRQAHHYCGHVFIHGYDPHAGSAELGFVVRRAFEGQGFAVEMAQAVLAHTRLQLGCGTVSATVDEDHERSKAVLARIGMKEVARAIDAQGVFLTYRAG